MLAKRQKLHLSHVLWGYKLVDPHWRTVCHLNRTLPVMQNHLPLIREKQKHGPRGTTVDKSVITSMLTSADTDA